MSEEKNPDWRENDAPKIPSIYSYPNKLDELLKDVKNYEDAMHTLFYKDDNGMMKEEKHDQLPDADKAKKKAYKIKQPDGSFKEPASMAPGETGYEGAFDKSMLGGASGETPANALKRRFPDVKTPPVPAAPSALSPAKSVFRQAEQKKMTTEDVKNLQGVELEKILKDSEAYEKYLGITNHVLPKTGDELVNTQEVPKDSDKSKIK